MGNSIVRDFHQVKISGKSDVPPHLAKEMIAPRSSVLKEPMTLLIHRDDHRRSTIAFNMSTMLPILVTTTKRTSKKSGDKVSVTKDELGRALFVITQPSRGKYVIYKAPQTTAEKKLKRRGSGKFNLDVLNEDTSESRGGRRAQRRGSGKSIGTFDDDMSEYSTTTAFTHTYDTGDLPCRAEIEIDRSGSTACGFFSSIVWNGHGPEPLLVYKAILVPKVKFGALVVDMKGKVVAKTLLDETRMEPVMHIGVGADVASVVTLVSAMLGF